MVSVEDTLTRFFYWLHPPLKKERDMLLERVETYSQRISDTEILAAKLTMENTRLKILVESSRRPETPKVVKVGTAAELRRIMELESTKQEDQDGV